MVTKTWLQLALKMKSRRIRAKMASELEGAGDCRVSVVARHSDVRAVCVCVCSIYMVE